VNILLTGGAGYIGSHACLSLLNSGFNITVVDDLSTGYKKLIPKGVDFVKTNINDTKTLNTIFNKKKYDVLIHFAGFIRVEESVKFPKKYFDNNTKNSEILFEYCYEKGINKIIFSSTAAVYGNPKKKIIEENTLLNPLNPYGLSKFETEKKLIQMKKDKKINFMILRYFNVAGADPELKSGLISKNPTHLIKIASEAATGKREHVTIYGNDYNTPDGTAIRDYIHVCDLVDIHKEAINFLIKKNKSAILNCGYGKGYSVKEILNEMNKICNNKIKIKNGNRRPGDAESLISDVSKLNEFINWSPKFNDIELILKTSINWEKKLKNEKIF
tara:strand:- start:6396 stop:7385 length:990 start_codon:yes stop_codon:yes gene_type:complete